MSAPSIRVAAAITSALAIAASVATPLAHATDWLPRFNAAAIAYWGAGALPECGQPVYLWVTNLDPEVDADSGQCLIRFNVDRWHRMPDAGMRCVLVFHEMGHEYGHQHSEGGLMAAAPPVVGWRSFAPCRRIVDPPRRTTRRPGQRAGAKRGS